jgi:ribosome biogenesis GTPase
MHDDDIEPLRSIGLNETLLRQAHDTLRAARPLPSEIFPDGEPTVARLTRVSEVHRETHRLHDGRGEHGARAAPWLQRDWAEHGDALAVGDWVWARAGLDGTLWIEARLPPERRLLRRDAHGHRHAVASHVDTALLVMGLDADFNPRRLERFLALLEGTGVAPLVVLTKADLVAPDPAMREAMVADEVDALRARVGTTLPLCVVDATQPDAALALAPWLERGRTLVLLGSSGAGKSTLTNSLLGEARQATGAVRDSDGRGQHTTTARVLRPLPSGACVIDTPGVRALRPDGGEAALDASFADIAEAARHCRFRDCQHQDEPGCAVRERVLPDRLANYRKLQRELRRDHLSVLERQRLLASWKQRGREGALRAKAKRGEP